jgi:hypothetical protein
MHHTDLSMLLNKTCRQHDKPHVVHVEPLPRHPTRVHVCADECVYMGVCTMWSECIEDMRGTDFESDSFSAMPSLP